jgi:catechol 2,3-dioxygenase-like lactoylglutathione lyase family enzyme
MKPLSLRLNVADLARSTRFYCDLLGFEPSRADPACLRLGASAIELLTAFPPGAPYPPASTAADLWFQHFAIRTADMARSHEILATFAHQPITIGGPQALPARSGGAVAYKFRDPDGHPLELLQLPDGGGAAEPGIDHTAISVADAERSIAFYRTLGFCVTGRQINTGPEQDRLDGLLSVEVEVVALALPAAPSPHLELLAYRSPRGRVLPTTAGPHDIAATRMVLDEAVGCSSLADPDGHRIDRL